jgi:small subunit ribosomal protein S16
MVRIRLRRVGGKKQPSFRIVAADKESPRDGRFLEILGYYNPRTEPATLQMKEDRIYEWMSKGAQPSDSVKKLFRSAGLLDRFTRFKEGESIEVLLEEAEEAAQARVGSPKTTGATPSKKSKPEEKVKAEPEPEVETEAETEVEAAVEPEVEAESELETEAEPEEEAEVETEAESEEEAEVEAAVEPEVKAEEEPEAEAEPEEEAEEEPEAEAEPEEEAEEEPEAEDDSEEEAEAGK